MTVKPSRGISTSMFAGCARARCGSRCDVASRLALRSALERLRRAHRALRASPSRDLDASAASYSRSAWPVCEPRMRRHVRRRADARRLAAGVAALGAEVDDPVGGARSRRGCARSRQRMARLDEPLERAQQLRDVVEVQAGGRLVEQEQRCRRRACVAAGFREVRPRASAAALRRPTASAPAGRAAGTRGRRRRAAAGARAPRRAPRRRRAPRATVMSSTSAIDFASRPPARASPRAPRRGSACRCSPGSAGTRRDRNCISTCSKPLPPQVGQRPLPELKLNVPAVYLRSLRERLARRRACGSARTRRRSSPDSSAWCGRSATGRRSRRRRRARRPRALRCAPGVSVGLPCALAAAPCTARPATSVDLPEPDTPVTHTRRSSGNRDVDVLQVVLARAAHDEPRIAARRDAAARAPRADASACARADIRPVSDVGARRRSSAGEPKNTTSPPRSPGPGPMSRMRSAASMICGSCSTTTQRVAGVAQPLHHPITRPMSRGCRPIDGSSSTNSVLTSEVPSAVVRLMRCTSPPDERARLAVEREIAQADVAEVTEPRADLAEQQSVASSSGCGSVEALEEVARALDRQQHEVVNREARQRANAASSSTPCGRKRCDGSSTASASAIEPSRQSSASGFSRAPSHAGQACTRGTSTAARARASCRPWSRATRRSAATPYQTLALLPRAFAFEHPGALRGASVAPRHVERDAALLRVTCTQVVLAFLVSSCVCHGLIAPSAQRLRLVRDHEAVVDADHAAEAAAGLAGAERRVEREQRSATGSR